MAQQIINTGTAPNDGTGDTLKTSFTKTNANFTELYTRPLGNAFTSSLTAPSSPNVGDLWYDTSVGALSIYVNDGNSLQWVQIAPGAVGSLTVTGSVGIMEPQGRLTLDPAYPVMIGTNSGNPTLWYAPYVGNNVPIYDGTMFSMMSMISSISCLLSDTSKNPSPIGASKINDWFVWNDAGVLRLSHGVDWTNDTTRNASIGQLLRVNGLWINQQAIANGPGAYRGTYVGTTKSTAGGMIPWITGGISAGATAAFLGIWNCYNRANISTIVGDTTSSWTYATPTWRPANNSTSCRLSFVSGLQEDQFVGAYTVSASITSNSIVVAGVGYDSTNAFSGITAANQDSVLTTLPAVTIQQSSGFHFFQAIEYATAATATFYGLYGGYIQSGFRFDGRM